MLGEMTVAEKIVRLLDKMLCLVGIHTWYEDSEKGFNYCTDCGKKKPY